MAGRRARALVLLLALAFPMGALAVAGVCEDECAPGCGDCGLCLGAAVGPAGAPGVMRSPAAAARSWSPIRPCTAPSGVREPVPLPVRPV